MPVMRTPPLIAQCAAVSVAAMLRTKVTRSVSWLVVSTSMASMPFSGALSGRRSSARRALLSLRKRRFNPASG